MEEIKIEIRQYKQLIKQLIPEITEKQMKENPQKKQIKGRKGRKNLKPLLCF